MQLMKILSFNNLWNLIYSLIFNLRYLPIDKAIHLPILISPNIKIGELSKGRIIILNKPHFGDIKIGLKASRGLITSKGYLSISKTGALIFSGKTKLSSGISIRIDNGEVIFGTGSFINGNCMFRCTKKIICGDYLLVGWNVSFSTDDGHKIIEDGKEKEKEKDINIGNHVWIASDTKIVKGVVIGDGCVVAQNSLVNSCFKERNLLIGGIPAKMIKNNIEWKL